MCGARLTAYTTIPFNEARSDRRCSVNRLSIFVTAYIPPILLFHPFPLRGFNLDTRKNPCQETRFFEILAGIL